MKPFCRSRSCTTQWYELPNGYAELVAFANINKVSDERWDSISNLLSSKKRKRDEEREKLVEAELDARIAKLAKQEKK